MKIIFLDADGTLFHPEGYIPSSAKKAIQIAKENGHKICLCTGRQRKEIYGDLASINYDGMVTGAGSLVEAKDIILQDIHFNKEQIQQLIDYMQEYKIPCIFESNFELYGNQECVDTLEKLVGIFCKDLNEEDKKRHGVYRLYSSVHLTPYDKIEQASVNKISFLESNTKYKEIYDSLHHDFDVIPSTFAPFGKESGEIADYRISKGNGMKILSRYYNIKKEDIIAIGDGANDLPMFEVAGLSIAMANGKDALKEKADYITTALDDDGIYNAFKHFNLI